MKKEQYSQNMNVLKKKKMPVSQAKSIQKSALVTSNTACINIIHISSLLNIVSELLTSIEGGISGTDKNILLHSHE